MERNIKAYNKGQLMKIARLDRLLNMKRF